MMFMMFMMFSDESYLILNPEQETFCDHSSSDLLKVTSLSGVVSAWCSAPYLSWYHNPRNPIMNSARIHVIN